MIPTTQNRVRPISRAGPDGPGNNADAYVSLHPQRHQRQGRQGHGDKQLDLMMQQVAVVQNADHQQQGGSRENTKDLAARGAVYKPEDRKDRPAVDRNSAQ